MIRRIRLLVPNTDRDLLKFLINLVCDLGNSVESVMPNGDSDDDILQLACLTHWDASLLIVNNIAYPKDVSIEIGATELVSKLARFEKPLVATYGWPQNEALAAQLLRAGATSAFRIPCTTPVIQAALAAVNWDTA